MRSIVKALTGEMSGDAARPLGRARFGIVGFAAYLLAAMAFVDPTLAGECEQTARSINEAARDANLGAEELARIAASVELALSHRANGDELGCLSQLAETRKLLDKRG